MTQVLEILLSYRPHLLGSKLKFIDNDYMTYCLQVLEHHVIDPHKLHGSGSGYRQRVLCTEILHTQLFYSIYLRSVPQVIFLLQRSISLDQYVCTYYVGMCCIVS